MRRVITAILILIPMLLFTGCTKYWYQEEKSFLECEQDLDQCHSEMKRYRDDVQHSLGVYDLRFEEECMKEKGYRLVTERQLSLRIKRRGPDTSREQKHGVAGTLEQ